MTINEVLEQTVGEKDLFHDDWNNSIYTWTMVRDCVKGEAAVKRKNELYLPMPMSMLLVDQPAASAVSTDFSVSSVRNPNFHTNQPYSAYKTRANVREIAGFTLRGLIGTTVKQAPTIELPQAMEYLLTSATKTNRSLNSLFYYILEEVLQTGRVPTVIDIDEKDGKPKFVLYPAEALRNWKASVAAVDAAELKWSLFTQAETIQSDNPAHILYYSVKGIVRTAYVVGKQVIDSTPIYKGKTLDVLPVTIIGSTNLTPDVDKIPLGGISKLQIQMYQLDADLRQAEYLTCNPTLVLSGIDREDTPSVMGSQVALRLPDPQAKAYYTKTDTSALSHMLLRLKDQQSLAQDQGASLLGSPKDSAESGEALRIRQESTAATIASVVSTIGEGIELQLRRIAIWMGLDPTEVSFKPSTEFSTYTMTAQEQQALVQSWVAGGLSRQTLLDNYRRAGLLQTGQTVQQEMDQIDREIAEGVTNSSTKPAVPAKTSEDVPK